MVSDHSDTNPLPPHGLLFLTSSKGSFICTINRLVHTQPLLHQLWSTGWNEEQLIIPIRDWPTTELHFAPDLLYEKDTLHIVLFLILIYYTVSVGIDNALTRFSSCIKT